MKKILFILLLILLTSTAVAQTVEAQPQPTVGYGITDTIEQRNNVSEYNKTFYDNGTVKDVNWTG